MRLQWSFTLFFCFSISSILSIFTAPVNGKTETSLDLLQKKLSFIKNQKIAEYCTSRQNIRQMTKFSKEGVQIEQTRYNKNCLKESTEILAPDSSSYFTEYRYNSDKLIYTGYSRRPLQGPEQTTLKVKFRYEADRLLQIQTDMLESEEVFLDKFIYSEQGDLVKKDTDITLHELDHQDSILRIFYKRGEKDTELLHLFDFFQPLDQVLVTQPDQPDPVVTALNNFNLPLLREVVSTARGNRHQTVFNCKEGVREMKLHCEGEKMDQEGILLENIEKTFLPDGDSYLLTDYHSKENSEMKTEQIIRIIYSSDKKIGRTTSEIRFVLDDNSFSTMVTEKYQYDQQGLLKEVVRSIRYNNQEPTYDGKEVYEYY